MRSVSVVLTFLFFLWQQPLQAQFFADTTVAFSYVPQIPLQNINGEKVVVSLHAKPLTLLIFLSPECPLCRNYTLALNNLKKRFAQQVQVVGIVPGTAYEKDAVRNFKKDYNIQFALLSDAGKELTGYMKATITPEVVLISGKGAIIYRGAIDDWMEELGKKKLKPETFYLEDAIKQFIAGEIVTVKTTIPKGCYINEF